MISKFPDENDAQTSGRRLRNTSKSLGQYTGLLRFCLPSSSRCCSKGRTSSLRTIQHHPVVNLVSTFISFRKMKKSAQIQTPKMFPAAPKARKQHQLSYWWLQRCFRRMHRRCYQLTQHWSHQLKHRKCCWNQWNYWKHWMLRRSETHPKTLEHFQTSGLQFSKNLI